MELLGDVVMWNLSSFCLEVVLASVQDRCMVCTRRTIGSESFLTHPMELHGDVGPMESCFGPFGHCVSVGARLLHILRQT